MKRFKVRLVVFLCGLLGFLLANAASYLFRTTAPFAEHIEDGFRGIRFPFLVWLEGGFAGVRYFSATAILLNVAVAVLASGIIATAFIRKPLGHQKSK